MICQKCGLPKELCVCEDISKEEQKIRVRKEKRRYGKFVTIVDGFQKVDVDKVAKELKTKLACGGTSKNGQIELQGDHLHKTKDILITIGFPEESINVF